MITFLFGLLIHIFLHFFFIEIGTKLVGERLKICDFMNEDDLSISYENVFS